MHPAVWPVVLGRSFYPGSSLALDFSASRYRDVAGGSVLRDLAAFPGWTLTRASTDYARNGGGVYVPFASGVPASTDLGLQIEVAATNLANNPRAEGGSAGVNPTNWTVAQNASVTVTPVGVMVLNGIEGMAYDIAGTASATTASTISWSGTTATAGDAFTGSPFVALLSGSLTGISAIANRASWTGAGTSTDGSDIKASLTPNPLRAVTNYTAPASTTAVTPRLAITPINGQTLSARIWIGWPQFVKQAFVSSPILPPVGSPATSARAADLPAITGIAAGSSVVVGFTLAALSGVQQQIGTIDNGTNNERVDMYVDAAGVIRARLISGGAVVGGSIGFGTAVAGVAYRLALSFTASRLAGSLNGGAVVSATPTGFPTSLTARRFGYYTPGTLQLGGVISRWIESLPAKSDGEL